jgi:acyl-CoA synthetase (AMP-forming)/AMP-acid ligase II
MDLAGQVAVGEILPTQAARADLARKPALYFEDQTYTYAELEAASAIAAHERRTCSIGAGDTVGLILPNCPALVSYLFGILRIGATVLPLNPSHAHREISLMPEESGARVLVTTGNQGVKFQGVRAPSSSPRLAPSRRR